MSDSIENIWDLIHAAPQPSSRRRSEQKEWIADTVGGMSAAQAERLAAQLSETLRRGQTKPVWAALKLFILDNSGLSVGTFLYDDCAWVMLHGRSTYEAFLATPDSLADLASIEYEWDVHFGGGDLIEVFSRRVQNESLWFKMPYDEREQFRNVSVAESDFPRLFVARTEFLKLPLFKYQGQPEGKRYEYGEVRAKNRDEALRNLKESGIRVDSIHQA
jgi:hypothetical protein